jgi:hypothetical protein
MEPESKSYTQNVCGLGHYYTSSESKDGNCPHCSYPPVFINTVKIGDGMEYGVIAIKHFEQFILIPEGSLGKPVYKIPLYDEMACYREDICIAWPEDK